MFNAVERSAQALAANSCLVERGEVLELLEGGLLREDFLVDHAAEADHGQTSVLELRELVPAQGRVVTAQVQGVEVDVARRAAISEHVARGDLATVGEDLDATQGEKNLPEAGGGDGEESIERQLGVEAGQGQVDTLLHPEPEAAEHADAAVLQLSLAEPLDVEIVGEPEGVETNVTRHGAVQRGRAREERHRLRAVELHLGGCTPRDHAHTSLARNTNKYTAHGSHGHVRCPSARLPPTAHASDSRPGPRWARNKAPPRALNT